MPNRVEVEVAWNQVDLGSKVEEYSTGVNHWRLSADSILALPDSRTFSN